MEVRAPKEIRTQLRKEWNTDVTNHYNYNTVREEIEAELEKAIIKIKELKEENKTLQSKIKAWKRLWNNG